MAPTARIVIVISFPRKEWTSTLILLTVMLDQTAYGQLVPVLSSDLYRPSRLLMAPCSELDANPSELNSTLVLPLSSFKLLSLLRFIHRNIVDPIMINNNHEFLLLSFDLRYYSLLLFTPPLELALSISCTLYDIFTSLVDSQVASSGFVSFHCTNTSLMVCFRRRRSHRSKTSCGYNQMEPSSSNSRRLV
jgi:hypothetical protein